MSEEFWNFLGWITTVIVSILGWFIAFKQINSQNKSTEKLETNKLKKDLQIRASEEIVNYLFEIRKSLISPWLYLTALPIDLKLVVSTDYRIVPDKSWDMPSSQLVETWKPVMDKFLSFIYFFDSREVILHEFVSFQKELRTKYSFLSTEIFNFSDYLRDFYDTHYLTHSVTEEDISALFTKRTSIISLIDDIQHVIDEYNIRLQNTFLSEVFSYTIPPRTKAN